MLEQSRQVGLILCLVTDLLKRCSVAPINKGRQHSVIMSGAHQTDSYIHIIQYSGRNIN